MLPKHMFEYLEAPVPFIIGIAALPEDEQFIKKLEETCIVVYIDQSKISEPKVKMPSLPEPKKLKAMLKSPHKELSTGTKKPNPYQTLANQSKLVPDIVAAFKSWHSWLLDDVIVKSITSTNFIEFNFDDEKQIDVVVQNMPKGYKEFMEQFMKGQIFNSYSEKLKPVVKKQDKPVGSTSPKVKRGLSFLKHTRAFSGGSIEKQPSDLNK